MIENFVPLINVLISADAEWQAVREHFLTTEVQESPLGQWFPVTQERGTRKANLIFFHGGWGKVAAAASTQYVISRWSPDLLVNLGTCGGFLGQVERGTVILAERTVVYDIYDQMGDPEEAIRHYTTDLDLSWLTVDLPPNVQRDVLVSADCDLRAEDLAVLHRKYKARAGDWESGAIAYVADRNNTRCLILRGVSDLVSEEGGEAYSSGANTWFLATQEVMSSLLMLLTSWATDLVGPRAE